MSKSDDLRKHELACLRLESEALQLAREVENPALKSHFLQKAREWLDLSARYPGTKVEITNFDKQARRARATLH
jgi:hypothetical protein